MSKEEDLLRNLREMIKEQGIESFHLLEELVPMAEQMEFFRKSDIARKLKMPFDKDEEIVVLFSPNQSIRRKKESLLNLSTIPDVQCYRAIETYHSSPQEEELHNWSTMALLASKIILSSNLSGQQQVYISSGLGGLDKKLRFFGIFSTKDQEPFTDFQKEVVEREFKFQFSQNDIDIERFEFSDKYFTLLILFPLEMDAKESINATIEEINNYGNFLDTKYLFTNVRVLDEDEIERMLKSRLKRNKDKDIETEVE